MRAVIGRVAIGRARRRAAVVRVVARVGAHVGARASVLAIVGGAVVVRFLVVRAGVGVVVAILTTCLLAAVGLDALVGHVMVRVRRRRVIGVIHTGLVEPWLGDRGDGDRRGRHVVVVHPDGRHDPDRCRSGKRTCGEDGGDGQHQRHRPGADPWRDRPAPHRGEMPGDGEACEPVVQGPAPHGTDERSRRGGCRGPLDRVHDPIDEGGRVEVGGRRGGIEAGASLAGHWVVRTPNWARSVATPRDNRDLIVPTGRSVIRAISSTERSPKNRSITTSPWSAGRWATASSSVARSSSSRTRSTGSAVDRWSTPVASWRRASSSETAPSAAASRAIATRNAMRRTHAPNGPSPRNVASDWYARTNASWAASWASAGLPRTR